MTPLEQVTEKIWELLPDDRKCIDGKFDEMITLEDVLIALKGRKEVQCMEVSEDGTIMFARDDIDWPNTVYEWKLGKPLHEQEEETILFLNEIL